MIQALAQSLLGEGDEDEAKAWELSVQSIFVLDRVREYLPACDPQLRLVSRWFRDALAAVPHQQLRVEDYFSSLPLFLWARGELGRMPRGDEIADKAALL
ncbi:hypothetical protein B484DRAFT_410681, partial [Ochromonadaceae sp. CCMP2298]